MISKKASLERILKAIRLEDPDRARYLAQFNVKRDRAIEELKAIMVLPSGWSGADIQGFTDKDGDWLF